MSRSNEKNRNGRWVELEERQLFQISYSYWVGGDDGDWELFHDSFMSKRFTMIKSLPVSDRIKCSSVFSD